MLEAAGNSGGVGSSVQQRLFVALPRPRCLARGFPWPQCICVPVPAAAASFGPGHSAQGVDKNPTAASQGEDIMPHHRATPLVLRRRSRGRIQFRERVVHARATRFAFSAL